MRQLVASGRQAKWRGRAFARFRFRPRGQTATRISFPHPGSPVPHAQLDQRLLLHSFHQERQQAVLRQVSHRLGGDGGLVGRGLAPAVAGWTGRQGAEQLVSAAPRARARWCSSPAP